MAKRKPFNLDEVPDAVKRLNPHLFNRHGGMRFNPIKPTASRNAGQEMKRRHGNDVAIRDFPVVSDSAANTASTRGRVDSLNKTERRFYESLIPELFKGQDYIVIVQPTRLFELTGGGTYTPDFLVCTNDSIHVCEVKGQYRGPGWEQGVERYKRAAAQFNVLCIHFAMYTWMPKEQRWILSKWSE